jgi:hypothetical protein
VRIYTSKNIINDEKFYPNLTVMVLSIPKYSSVKCYHTAEKNFKRCVYRVGGKTPETAGMRNNTQESRQNFVFQAFTI